MGNAMIEDVTLHLTMLLDAAIRRCHLALLLASPTSEIRKTNLGTDEVRRKGLDLLITKQRP